MLGSPLTPCEAREKLLRVARSIQFSKNQGLSSFSAVAPPQMRHPISRISLRPFFGGTFQTYDDCPYPVNPFFRLLRKFFRGLSRAARCSRPRTSRRSCF